MGRKRRKNSRRRDNNGKRTKEPLERAVLLGYNSLDEKANHKY
ncbi:MAG: hypothetical protein PHW75_00830 [Patescibacteria group bacterium]|nr:hypothetical protein [Patescibacteria group bacterium]